MSELTHLKKKIQSIETTQKITHAVRLVSMSLYGRLERQNVPLREYTAALQEQFAELVKINPSWNNPLAPLGDSSDGSPLFIIVATTKGLCGGLNSNLFRLFENSFSIDSSRKPTFITIGKKAYKFVKNREFGEVLRHYSDFSHSSYLSIINDLTDKFSHREYNFSSVTFYSNFLRSFFVQEPKKTVLLPLAVGDLVKKDNGSQHGEPPIIQELIWEQSTSQVLDYMSQLYLKSSISNILFQALIAEQSARFLAMDNSTTNAEQFLEKLTLMHNKKRQALITREVSELSAGLLD